MTLDQSQPIPKRGRSVYLETFGCQMNELDSELVRGHLNALGYTFTSDVRWADIVLYNTCSVREQAENKVLSRIGLVGKEKENGREVVLGVLGCMAERDGGGMMTKYPQVDLMCGPGELDKLPMLLDNAYKTGQVEKADLIALQGNRSRRSQTLAAADDNLEMLDLSRAFDPDRGSGGAGGRSAYVRITRGCNKFCTYCVVPFTRGAEVHRPPDAIVEECRKLADEGVIEITLLGQTVNHYVYTHGAAVTVAGREAPQVGPGLKAFRKRGKSPPPFQGGGQEGGNGVAKELLGRITSGSETHPPTPSLAVRGRRTTTFADLLRRIHDEVPAIQRLRFVTSYPRDFHDDSLQVMAESPRICRYLHVPAQSGSNRILKRMNRGYTAEEYLDFIDRARAFMPDVSIAGDIIVGFPTETEQDFEATKDLLRRVPFKNNFIFKYSPRPGTVAFDRMPDDVPDAVKRRRNNELLALQAEVSERVHREWVGREVEVFVEQVGARAGRRNGRVELGWARPRIQLTGRTGGDLIVAFDRPENAVPDEVIGTIQRIRITEARSLLLTGEVVEVACAAV